MFVLLSGATSCCVAPRKGQGGTSCEASPSKLDEAPNRKGRPVRAHAGTSPRKCHESLGSLHAFRGIAEAQAKNKPWHSLASELVRASVRHNDTLSSVLWSATLPLNLIVDHTSMTRQEANGLFAKGACASGGIENVIGPRRTSPSLPEFTQGRDPRKALLWAECASRTPWPLAPGGGA